MDVIRLLLAAALLAGVAYGSRGALVALLAWHAVALWRLRRELFLQQEADALRRLGDYWRSLTNRE